MKILLPLFLSCLIATQTCSGQDLNFSNVTFDKDHEWDYYSPANINITSSDHIVNNLNQQFVAGNAVKYTPGTGGIHIKPYSVSSTGIYNAIISNQSLNVQIKEPAAGNVGIYSKLEIGIDYNDIDSKVSTFLTSLSLKPGTVAYDNAFNSGNGTIINPYDPDHISVEATFYSQANPSKSYKRYGFYYKAYTRNNPTNPTDWISLSDNYEWRIRFAPPSPGLWYCNIFIFVNKTQRISKNYTLIFTVDNSSNPGYLKKASNNRYLMFDHSGQPFFPIGDNFPWVDPCYCGCPTINCTSNSEWRLQPTAYKAFDNYIQKLTQSGAGGNFTTLMTVPWSLDVEWEKLNNYNTRQVEMWEMDEIFKKYEQNGIYAIFSLMGSSDITKGNDSTAQGTWLWNPYNNNSSLTSIVDINKPYKGLINVNHNEDFYSDAGAKNFYKKRLRYIISRWGYSTSIAMYQLVTEFDNSWSDFWTVNSTRRDNVFGWNDEMAKYIRGILTDPHLITTSYTGDSFKKETDNKEASILSLSSIDIITGHNYNPNENTERFMAGEAISYSNLYNKPINYGESEIWPFLTIGRCTNYTFHNRIWASSFSGVFGSSMAWEKHRYEDNWEGNSGAEYESNYKTLKLFTNQINFTHTFTPRFEVKDHLGNYSKYESFYLKDESINYVYGWFHNRSFFWRNFNQNCYNSINECSTTYNLIKPYVQNCFDCGTNDFCLANDNDRIGADNYITLFTNQWQPTALAANTGELYLRGLSASTLYTIHWFYTWGSLGGQENLTYLQHFTTDASGNGIITSIPPTGNTNSGDWAFVVKPGNAKMVGTQDQSTNFIDCKIVPNPNNGVFTINFNNPQNCDLFIYDTFGRLVFNQLKVNTSTLNVDISEQPKGIYFIRITDGESYHLIKVINQ